MSLIGTFITGMGDRLGTPGAVGFLTFDFRSKHSHLLNAKPLQ
jgi:hypothetical protein